jgi:hypothetical protein
LVTKTSNQIILSLYRAPSGDVNEFLRWPYATSKHPYNPESAFIVWGDINYLNESNQKKKQVKSLVKTYNVSYTVNFETRIRNSSSTAIDNIFIDSARLSSSCTSPIVNCLLDPMFSFLQ